jgi:ribokinase
MPARVCVIGSINVDLVVLADRLPEPGETVLGGRFSSHGGGKGANQAVAAARAGAEVTMIGAVGDDSMRCAPRASTSAAFASTRWSRPAWRSSRSAAAERT